MTKHRLGEKEEEEAPKGPLEIAMQHALFLLEEEPTLAEEQAREIIRAFPDEARAYLVLAKALRQQGDAKGALAAADAGLEKRKAYAEADVERGLALAALGDRKKAVDAYKRALKLAPKLADAWRALGDQLALAGDKKAADRAYARYRKLQLRDSQ